MLSAYTEGTGRVHFQNFPMCHPPLFPLAFFFLHFNYTLHKVQELKFVLLHPVPVTVSALRSAPPPSPQDLKFPVWSFFFFFFLFPAVERCTSEYAVLAELHYKPHCGSSGIQAGGGWESGAHCGGAAELFMPPPPPHPTHPSTLLPACLHSSLQYIHWDLHNSVNERSLSLPFTKS